MIKRSPIERQWQVNLFCDNCDSIMERLSDAAVQFFGGPVIEYSYICPKCGKITKSKELYPYTQVEFDLGNSEVID